MRKENFAELKLKLIERAKNNPPMKLENAIYKMWECPNCFYDINDNEDGICPICGQKYLKR